MNLLDVLNQGAQQAGAGTLGRVTIESALFPAIHIDPFAGGDGGGPSLVALLVRPKVTVETPLGTFSSAPAGDPPAFPWLGVTIAALAVMFAVLATRGART